MNNTATRLPVVLLCLRLTVFLVMVMWTIDKFVRPGHAATVLSHFYSLHGMGAAVVYAVAAVELLILSAFVAGLWKNFTYAVVLVFHAATTIVSWQQYFNPYEGVNLLFFAAWPMLAACFALYYLRAADTLLTLPRAKARVAS